MGERARSDRSDLIWIGHAEEVPSFKKYNRSYMLGSQGKAPI